MAEKKRYPSERSACHPEERSDEGPSVIGVVAGLATMTVEKFPHLPAARAPALGMIRFLRPPPSALRLPPSAFLLPPSAFRLPPSVVLALLQ